MRLVLIILLAAAATVPGRAEIRTTTRTVLEAGCHYDDNILFPDSITGEPSFKQELFINNKWFIQFTRSQMLRTGLTFWSEQINAFPNENIRNFGADLEYRNFLSHKTMVNAQARYFYQFSPSEFYRTEYAAGQFLTGHYLGPKTYIQGKYEAGLKRFPDYYNIDLLSPGYTRYYSYDYLRHSGAVLGRYTLGDGWSVEAEHQLHYKDYYEDNYDLDFLDSAASVSDLTDPPLIDYTAIHAVTWRDSLDSLGGPPGWDTSFYFGSTNIRQQDTYNRTRLVLKYVKRKKFSLELGTAGRFCYSTDPYYRYRGADTDLAASYLYPFVTLRLYYRLILKSYPDRYTDASLSEQQQDLHHFIRLGLVHAFEKYLSVEFQYSFNRLFSNYAADEYRKNVFTVNLSYKK